MEASLKERREDLNGHIVDTNFTCSLNSVYMNKTRALLSLRIPVSKTLEI